MNYRKSDTSSIKGELAPSAKNSAEVPSARVSDDKPIETTQIPSIENISTTTEDIIVQPTDGSQPAENVGAAMVMEINDAGENNTMEGELPIPHVEDIIVQPTDGSQPVENVATDMTLEINGSEKINSTRENQQPVSAGGGEILIENVDIISTDIEQNPFGDEKPEFEELNFGPPGENTATLIPEGGESSIVASPEVIPIVNVDISPYEQKMQNTSPDDDTLVDLPKGEETVGEDEEEYEEEYEEEDEEVIKKEEAKVKIGAAAATKANEIHEININK
ncbi:MAG: hypothetical protein LBB13_01765 [Rickettsiales bacterium]|jgi:hypothetical protein|nr:hypothetical protein [Rickettsiales bacterium]